MKKIVLIITIFFLILVIYFVYSRRYVKDINVALGVDFKLFRNVKATFKDDERDNYIILKSIKHIDKCPRGAKCIWAGEILISIDFNGESYELKSTTNNKILTNNKKYVISFLNKRLETNYAILKIEHNK